jgi:inhibitor of cysteine peptidase
MFYKLGAESISIDSGSDGGHSVMALGDILLVSLKGNPTTGYIWTYEKPNMTSSSPVLSLVLEIDGSEYAYTPDPVPSSGFVGSGGTFLFRFSATGEGDATLKLSYLRPWEKGTSPTRVFTFAVTVVKA